MEHLWFTRTPGHVVRRPEEFGYRTDLPALEAPASRSLRVDENTEVELRVGPGHHQCVVGHHGDTWIETVDVFEDAAAGLPVLRSEAHPTPFASQVETGCTVTEHSPRGCARSCGGCGRRSRPLPWPWRCRIRRSPPRSPRPRATRTWSPAP